MCNFQNHFLTQHRIWMFCQCEFLFCIKDSTKRLDVRGEKNNNNKKKSLLNLDCNFWTVEIKYKVQSKCVSEKKRLTLIWYKHIRVAQSWCQFVGEPRVSFGNFRGFLKIFFDFWEKGLWLTLLEETFFFCSLNYRQSHLKH